MVGESSRPIVVHIAANGTGRNSVRSRTGVGGTLYAVDTAGGAIDWTGSVENGDHSSPVVTDDGVYVSYACDVSYKFDPTTGADLWTHTTGCEGGGGSTSVLHGSSLYVRGEATSHP